MSTKSTTHQVVRSAETGQFVKPIEAVRHPRTTVTETIRSTPRPAQPVTKKK